MQWLAIALGGALGALGRFAITAYAYPVLENRFPLGTLLINVVGSFLIGVCYVLIIERGAWAPEWRYILMTGFLGAFTTFSTFSLEALSLWQNGQPMLSAVYVVASVAGGLIAVATSVTLTLKIVS